MKEHNTYFPLFIPMEGKKVIIYGGGNIAARRAAALLRFGAKVLLFSPAVGEAVKELGKEYPEALEVYERPYERGIPPADFVLSAVDEKQVDLAIYRECKERGIPVNIASDRSLCDFYFPALVEWEENDTGGNADHRDPVPGIVIGISSGGRDHKKVKWMAQKIREFVGGIK